MKSKWAVDNGICNYLWVWGGGGGEESICIVGLDKLFRDILDRPRPENSLRYD